MPNRIIFASKIILHYKQISMLQSPWGDMVMENNMRWETNYISMLLCPFTKLLHYPKTFAFSRKTLCSLNKIFKLSYKTIAFSHKTLEFSHKSNAFPQETYKTFAFSHKSLVFFHRSILLPERLLLARKNTILLRKYCTPPRNFASSRKMCILF